jgi:subtilisin family serine protease
VVLEGSTWRARHINDMLIFAIAGNTSTNVDKLRCYSTKNAVTDFIAGVFDAEAPNITVCPWEESWTWPCENAGVNCVEGSNFTNRDRDGRSSFGPDTVMHRASFENIVAGLQSTDTQLTAPDRAHRFTGTSGSTPLVAGIAALTWAADLSQDAGDVEACLIRSGKFVDALDSVRCALGEPPLPDGNLAPRVEIRTPKDNETLDDVVTSVTLIADGGDETGPLEIQWFVNEVPVGTAPSGGTVLYPITTTGTFVAEARAIDATGKTGSDKVTFFIPPNPPGINIVLPGRDGDTAFAGLPVDLFSQVHGRPPIPPCSTVTWSATLGGVPVLTSGPNCVRQETFASPGAVVLTSSYSDVLGMATATRSINVVDDGLPHVKIKAPQRDQFDGPRAVALIPDGDPLGVLAGSVPVGATFAYSWTITAEGQATSSLTTALQSTSIPINYALGNCAHIEGTVTVMISDAAGHVDDDSIPVIFFSKTCNPI